MLTMEGGSRGGQGGGEGTATFHADSFPEELGQGLVGGALTQRPLDIQLRRGKETRPQPTGRGEAQAVAGGAVVIADGADEAQLPLKPGDPERPGRAGGGRGGDRLQGTQPRQTPADLGHGQEVAAPSAPHPPWA